MKIANFPGLQPSRQHLPMPRRLPKRPPRPCPPSPLPQTHRFLPLHLSRSLIRRENVPSSLESKSTKKLPPKIVALDSVPRIPLSPNPADHARRLAQIEQIKQLYSPREFKRLRDEQMKLVLPESPLKTTAGRIRLSILVWIYVSLGVLIPPIPATPF